MWTKDTQQANNLSEDLNNYNFNSINIYCTRGVHEKAFEMFVEGIEKDKEKSKEGNYLVLGSGEGAFDERLIQNGYKNVTSVEFCEGIYKSSGRILIRDLNQDFSDIRGVDNKKFDAIFAIEVIEHLENHHHFTRNLNSLLNKENINASIFITSPNAESTVSRIKYFLRGTLNYFSVGEMVGTGHINPVFMHVFRYSLEKNTNLEIKKIETNTNVWNMSQYPTFKQKVLTALLWPLSIFMKNKDSKQINILEIKNK